MSSAVYYLKPAQVREIRRLTAEGDEHWFRLHPDAGERDRPLLQHETDNVEPGMDRVIVRRVRAGEFIRRAYQSKKGSA